MKDKKIIYILVGLIFILGIMGFILWNNRTISTITLDINPSVEIKLGKNEKVKSVKALNEDAKDIITSDLKGTSLEDSINKLTEKVIEKGYAEEGRVVVLVYSKGSTDNQNVEEIVRKSFDERHIQLELIAVENISKEDIKLAKKNNISPAKAAYINSIVEEKAKIEIKDLVEKPVEELLETKNTGRYCSEGYQLEGDFCLKEVKRVKAPDGLVCPEGYYDYEGVCYEEVPSEELDEMFCQDEFELMGNKCRRTIIIEAEPKEFSCPRGEAKTRSEMELTGPDAGDANYVVCVDTSHATHPVNPCELPADDPTERTFVGGRCYWHRAPVIAEGCPGKVQVDGMCWDDASNILICVGARDGKQYSSRDEFCENSIEYIDPIVTEYRCEDGFKLNGNKCEKEEEMDAMHERTCPKNYTLVNNDRCINHDKTANKTNGFVCDEENTRLKGNECIYYEIVESNHS